MRRLMLLAPLLLCVGAAAAPPEEARLPVREVTVFKDGHAFVVHAGRMPVDAQGDVRLAKLPVPVLGTFWPFSRTPEARLAAVRASLEPVAVPRRAVTGAELLLANPGAQIAVVQLDGRRYNAEVVEVPRAEPVLQPEEGARAVGQSSLAGRAGSRPDTVLLKTESGVSVVPIALIKSFTFRGSYRKTVPEEELRGTLRLDLDWAGGRAGREAEVGMGYLQRGLRWIPHYRVDVDGTGTAKVKLQATLVNELVDLQDATVHLVIGVGSFPFEKTPDPIALQQFFPTLSRHFEGGSLTSSMLSNALMSQVGGFGGMGGGMAGGRNCGEQEAEPGADAVPLGRNEDLYIFSLPHISLRKGENAVLPVAEYTLPYRDVYVVDMPALPPPELAGSRGGENNRELSRLLRVPRAEHRIRLRNSSPHPLTTAPVLLVRDGRVLAQSLMAYAPAGAEADVAVTTAGEIRVSREDRETARVPNAMVIRGISFFRVELSGKIVVANMGQQAVEVEIRRAVPGKVLSATGGGAVEQLSPFDVEDALPRAGSPYGGGSWPDWWTQQNGVGRITWKRRLEPGEKVELAYTWQYFTQ